MTGETPEVSIAMSKKVGTPVPILYLQVETPHRLQSASVKRALGCQLVLLLCLETPASAKSHEQGEWHSRPCILQSQCQGENSKAMCKEPIAILRHGSCTEICSCRRWWAFQVCLCCHHSALGEVKKWAQQCRAFTDLLNAST